jgi:cardiolipin synthase A/B
VKPVGTDGVQAARSRADKRRQGLTWYLVQRPVFLGANEAALLRGATELFPAMLQAIRAAQREVWLATYIFNNDAHALEVADALTQAARRGVKVRVVVDGFGSKHCRRELEQRLKARGLALAVFRPIERWTHWLQPGQLRRLHMKLCTVDGEVAFIGGINLIDDHVDLRHGRTDAPRLDYAVQLRGPLVTAIEQVARAMWSRAWFGRDWRQELRVLLSARQPLHELRRLLRLLRMPHRAAGDEPALLPVASALVVRDNLRQRRTIERVHIEAMSRARERIWLVTPYFYPGADFRRALREAAQRGVEVRLLLQGKVDYRLAALAARVLYQELMQHGVHIHEYTPAFLHAKVMLVDQHWCTIGSSNIDPLSLLLNLEANLVVQDKTFTRELADDLEKAFTTSREVQHDELRELGWVSLSRRAMVAWCAYIYLRVAGVTGRY